MNERIRKQSLASLVATGFALALLSLITGFSQIKTEGLGWQEEHYKPKLDAVIAGEAPAPDQYRLLTDFIVVGACRTAEIAGVPRPVGLSFVALRLLQNFALFALAFWYYRRLGIATYPNIIGLSALAWGMTQSNYGSDLAFNAYTDIILYLCAALILAGQRFEWLIPITVLAALNRESGALIPVMALCCAALSAQSHGKSRDVTRNGAIAMVLFFAIQVALWMHFGLREWHTHPDGIKPGLSMLTYNLGNDAAWGHVAGTLGIIPILAFMGTKNWHPLLRPLCWAVLPAWLLFHLLAAPLDQSRVLLMPQVLIFIPGMLCGLAQVRAKYHMNTPPMVTS